LFNIATTYLLSKGVQADCKDATGTTPFLIALKNGDYDSMDLLLMFKIDINGKGLRGNTALHLACAEGNSSKVKFLLDRNAQPTRSNNRGQTPLACALGSIMVLRELFDHMDTNNVPITKYLGMKDEEGGTLMHHCVENGFIDSANYILEYLAYKYTNSNGGLVNMISGSGGNNNNNNNNTSPTGARRSVGNHTGISLNSSSSSGSNSPVASKGSSGNSGSVFDALQSVHPLTSILAEKELLAGNTVLHLAVKLKREDFVQLFLNYSSYFDVNAQNKAGNTPLHIAIIMKYESIAKQLVLKGHANVKAKNAKKETAAQLAKTAGISLAEEIAKDNSNKRKSLFAFFTKK